MSHPDYYDPDPDYLSTFDAFVLGKAEETLEEADTLHEGGFAPVQVRGLDRLLWKRDGVLYTRERALSMVGST